MTLVVGYKQVDFVFYIWNIYCKGLNFDSEFLSKNYFFYSEFLNSDSDVNANFSADYQIVTIKHI